MRPSPDRHSLSPWARVRAFRAPIPESNEPDLHYHDEIEIVSIERGSGDVYFGSEIHPFRAGDIVMIDKAVEHRFRASTGEPAEALVLQFSPEALAGFDIERVCPLRLRGAIGMILRGPLAETCRPWLVESELHWREVETPADGLRLRATLLRLLADLAEGEAETVAHGASSPPIADEHREILDRVLATIREKHRDSIRLEEIAEVAGMRSESFCRFFKRHMGLTFTQYLNEVRLEAAARLLASSGRKVLEIGAEAGYSNLSYFNRRFRQRFGLTPQEFRRKHQRR